MTSIKKRPNGVWRARYRDDTGREHSAHRPTKREAQAWLDAATAQLVAGTHVDPRAGKVTLASFFADWSTRQVWATGTATAMSLAVRTATFSELELRKVRRSHLEAWVKQMHTAGLAPGTIRTRFNNVRTVLRAATRDRLVSVDPADGVTLPRTRKAEYAMHVPSTENVAAVMTAAEPWMAVYVALCAFAGLRLGEASAVQAGDIDFLRRTLHVRRQVQRAPGGRIEVTPPKHGSERDVYLADALLEMLARHIETQGVRGDEGWIFVGAHAEPPHQNTIWYQWQKVLGSAGVDAFRLHDLRHFYASGLIAAGCDVVTVQRAMGHGSATVTLSTYSHLWPNAEDRTRAAAGELMRAALAVPADRLRTAASGSLT